jgi:hypothetical protein
LGQITSVPAPSGHLPLQPISEVANLLVRREQGYQPGPIESELMDRIVPMRPTEGADLGGELPSSDEDATT